MLITARAIAGMGGVPASKPACLAWLKRHNVPEVQSEGQALLFRLSDLPEAVRLAYAARRSQELGLEVGAYDDAAHKALMQAPASLRDGAERRAELARFLVALPEDMSLADKVRAAQAAFGAEGTSKASVKRLLKTVAGVDPINFAPSLLPRYRGGRDGAPMSPEAWAFFMTTIRDAGPQFPLRQAWRDVRDVARKRGWA